MRPLPVFVRFSEDDDPWIVVHNLQSDHLRAEQLPALVPERKTTGGLCFLR